MKCKAIKGLAVLLVTVMALGSTAYAGPFEKFGRGAANLITSPGEIVYQPLLLAKDTNNGLIGFFGGLPKGILLFPVRAIVGALEVATCFVPVPKGWDYPGFQPVTLAEGFAALEEEASA
jgi:putative exosortase-associated protein (TIGR04073 family)